jgi:hypothetical protein
MTATLEVVDMEFMEDDEYGGVDVDRMYPTMKG